MHTHKTAANYDESTIIGVTLAISTIMIAIIVKVDSLFSEVRRYTLG